MSGKTEIEWTDATWNPVTGCSKVSAGCTHCYAETLDRRFAKTQGREWKPWNAPNAAHNVRLHPDRLEAPLHWRKPRKVFVNSMSDLFHEEVPFDYIDQVFAVMAASHDLGFGHTFQVLTKRPRRMLEYFNSYDGFTEKLGSIQQYMSDYGWTSPEDLAVIAPAGSTLPDDTPWSLPNVWIGVSVENQQAADERIPLLLETPAAVRFLSCEPLLGPVELLKRDYLNAKAHKVDWVIVGGESGPGARPIHPLWATSIRDQCNAAHVPFFFKQWGQWMPIDMPWESDSIKPLARNEEWLNFEGGEGFHGEHVYRMRRVGKNKAGRLLAGRVWDEFPKVGEPV